jgi:hypothetical protein
LKKLKVHENKRYLMWDDGTPFFYLGDTAWEMFHHLTKAEIEYYLSVRAQQGFTVIQAVALAEFGGLTEPNAYGRVPLLQKDGVYDPATPDVGGGYDYWQHVDYAIDTAAQKGMFIGLLPAWGDKFNRMWGEGPEIFTPENARVYGEWIANRYKDRWNIIWILGGDRPLETQQHRDIISALARGIRRADGNHLMTLHPAGCSSSVDFVAGQDYMDFHTVQSGHGTEAYESWKLVHRTGDAEAKPFMDSEPRYEDHPACFKAEYGYLWDAADVRQNAYWDLMEGVCGHTYGNHSIWKFNTEPQAYWPYRWQEVLQHDGACQIANLVKLRMSRPYFEFRSAPELVQDDPAAMAHQCAGRGERYAFIYSPLGQPIRASLQSLGGSAIRASWFDPRTAETKAFALVPPAEALFVPPTSGKGSDWVLVLDVMG